MAGLLLGASNSEAIAAALYAKGGKPRESAVVASFEKELNFILNTLWKKEKKASCPETHQRL